jgi:hypothetical protein
MYLLQLKTWWACRTIAALAAAWLCSDDAGRDGRGAVALLAEAARDLRRFLESDDSDEVPASLSKLAQLASSRRVCDAIETAAGAAARDAGVTARALADSITAAAASPQAPSLLQLAVGTAARASARALSDGLSATLLSSGGAITATAAAAEGLGSEQQQQQHKGYQARAPSQSFSHADQACDPAAAAADLVLAEVMCRLSGGAPLVDSAGGQRRASLEGMCTRRVTPPSAPSTPEPLRRRADAPNNAGAAGRGLGARRYAPQQQEQQQPEIISNLAAWLISSAASVARNADVRSLLIGVSSASTREAVRAMMAFASSGGGSSSSSGSSRGSSSRAGAHRRAGGARAAVKTSPSAARRAARRVRAATSVVATVLSFGGGC